jgi:hypothetical protein
MNKICEKIIIFSQAVCLDCITFVNAGDLIFEVNHSRKCVHSKVGSDVQVLSLDETNAMTICVVVDILQFVQNGDALLTLLLAVWK